MYGVWRFFIEYARGDYRGETFVSFLTPSQLIAVLLIVIGTAHLMIWYVTKRKHGAAVQQPQATEQPMQTKEEIQENEEGD